MLHRIRRSPGDNNRAYRHSAEIAFAGRNPSFGRLASACPRINSVKFGLQVFGLDCRAVLGDLNLLKTTQGLLPGYCRECANVISRDILRIRIMQLLRQI